MDRQSGGEPLGTGAVAVSAAVNKPRRKKAAVPKSPSKAKEDVAKGAAEQAVEPHPASTVRNLTALQHDRDTVRRLFETGEYPYRKKLRRRQYEQEKPNCRLSSSRSRTGSRKLVRRLSSCSKAVMLPARAVPSNGSWNISTRVRRGLWR